jgi:hypothetical protein
MYLVELHPLTGLIKVNGEFDGIRAVKEFRDVINNAKLGIQCMTAIALTVDHKTPIAYYSDKDRPYKAMEIATGGNRRAFTWAQEIIQKALKKYSELQYNPTIEEKKTLDEMLLNKLKEIQLLKDDSKKFHPLEEANLDNIEDLVDEFFDIKKLLGEKEFIKLNAKELKSLVRKANLYVIKPRNERKREDKDKRDEERVTRLFKELNTIKDLIKTFKKDNDQEDIYSDGPVRNGYKLTRLEEKAMDKNSFYHKER